MLTENSIGKLFLPFNYKKNLTESLHNEFYKDAYEKTKSQTNYHKKFLESKDFLCKNTRNNFLNYIHPNSTARH